jgi:hypothetical protein
MLANKSLLQRKYKRIVSLLAEETGMTLREALEYFYTSETYQEMSQGVSDMHCRSDKYLVEELLLERQTNVDAPCPAPSPLAGFSAMHGKVERN